MGSTPTLAWAASAQGEEDGVLAVRNTPDGLTSEATGAAKGGRENAVGAERSCGRWGGTVGEHAWGGGERQSVLLG